MEERSNRNETEVYLDEEEENNNLEWLFKDNTKKAPLESECGRS